ncbi:MAG TPA: class I SAM-dependent methyltransferase [Xanthomonadales bacterium]|nr:class I SAM-dependent methyltransferase [Xanthomonadales bacterium]
MSDNHKTGDYFEMNRAGWDRRAAVHLDSAFYDVAGFLEGKTSLREIELAELNKVEGKRLLHLQCHFGLDTLSWARLGAHATGVDLSPVAIKQASELADKSGVAADFVCSNVYDFDRGDADPYDIVFTSYGTICWLPDINRWAEIVSSNLAVGGTFYMAEFHPIHDLLAGYSYFTREIPDVEEEGTYTENSDDAVAEFAVWSHPISSVVNALVKQGIEIIHLNEFSYSPYDCFDNMKEREPGRFCLQHQGQDVPMVYSIRGKKKSVCQELADDRIA